mmetsp:Transcript_55275/g.98374  ORF Transcript_55275/g.98374 Transcript_55275/m.98374 type:complete len:274 (-) Transcript_55275:457-1278(-)
MPPPGPVGRVKDHAAVQSVFKYGYDVWNKEGHRYGDGGDVVKCTKVCSNGMNDWRLFTDRIKAENEEYEGIPVYRPSIDPKEKLSLYPAGTQMGMFHTRYQTKLDEEQEREIEQAESHAPHVRHVNVGIRTARAYSIHDAPTYTIREYHVDECVGDYHPNTSRVIGRSQSPRIATTTTIHKYHVDESVGDYHPNTSRVISRSQSPRMASTTARTFYADEDIGMYHSYRPKGGRFSGVSHFYERPVTYTPRIGVAINRSPRIGAASSRVYLEGQ